MLTMEMLKNQLGSSFGACFIFIDISGKLISENVLYSGTVCNAFFDIWLVSSKHVNFLEYNNLHDFFHNSG